MAIAGDREWTGSEAGWLTAVTFPVSAKAWNRWPPGSTAFCEPVRFQGGVDRQHPNGLAIPENHGGVHDRRMDLQVVHPVFASPQCGQRYDRGGRETCLNPALRFKMIATGSLSKFGTALSPSQTLLDDMCHHQHN